jgi:hypothetical protein
VPPLKIFYEFSLKGIQMFKKIKSWFRYDIPYGLKNLLVWFKVIWSDRNWDYHYIYIILRHKLDLMEKAIRSNNNHTEANRDADQIKECVDILDRLIDDAYFDLAYKDYEEKWGGIKFRVEENRLQLDNPKVQTPEDHEEERHDFKNAMMKENILKENDINRLFDLMKNNIQGWWD